jgi:uncharacterized protein YjlB
MISDYINTKPGILVHLLKDDGTFPNNVNLPLLLFQSAFRINNADGAAIFEDIISKNDWGR